MKDAHSLEVRQVTALERNEPYGAHLFHGGFLWVGKTQSEGSTDRYDKIQRLKQNKGSSTPGANAHRLEIYDNKGERLLATVELVHTPSYIYPAGESVVVVGKSMGRDSWMKAKLGWPDSWKSHYTEIKPVKGGFRISRNELPSRYVIDQMLFGPVSRGGAHPEMYFLETGDNAILASRGPKGNRSYVTENEITTLSPVIHFPIKPQWVGNSLFVIEGNSSAPNDDNLVKIDLASRGSNRRVGTSDRTFNGALRNGLTDLLALRGPYEPFSALALVEAGERQVLIVDGRSNSVVEAVKFESHPYAVSQLGKCLVTLLPVAKQVVFDDLMGKKRVAVWDISQTKEAAFLERPTGLTVDEASGRVFLRANNTCPTCFPSRNSVVSIAEAAGTTKAACTAK